MKKYTKKLEKWMKISKLVMFIIAPVIGIHSIWTTLDNMPSIAIDLIQQSGIPLETINELKKGVEYDAKLLNDTQKESIAIYKKSIASNNGFKKSIVFLTSAFIFVLLIEYFELKNSNELKTPSFYLFLIEYGENKGTVFKLAKGNSFTVGANINSNIYFMNSTFISGNHGKFLYKGDELRYEDHSTNGTMLLRENNTQEHIHKKSTLINHSDVLYLGNKDTKLRVIYVS